MAYDTLKYVLLKVVSLLMNKRESDADILNLKYPAITSSFH